SVSAMPSPIKSSFLSAFNDLNGNTAIDFTVGGADFTLALCEIQRYETNAISPRPNKANHSTLAAGFVKAEAEAGNGERAETLTTSFSASPFAVSSTSFTHAAKR